GILHRYSISDLHGYAGHFDPQTITAIKTRKEVAYVQRNRLWWINAQRVTQSHPPCGLNLISHRGISQEEKGYTYDSSSGKGTTVYVVDTGVDIEHHEFEGRAFNGFTINHTDGFSDNVGHGTHVAGILGSKASGVAKKCDIIAVKVLEGTSGPESGVMAGFDWAVKEIVSAKAQRKSVINVSLGGPFSPSWNRFADKAFELGVVTVVSAGNMNMDASNQSPGSAASVISVSATNQHRVRWSSSNWGKGVTLFAPGVDIVSTWPDQENKEGNATMTSMAAPYVTGIALYLQAMRMFNVRSVKETIAGIATRKVVGDIRGSPNLFAYNNG
ncbi:alkaline protease, partial [Myriangium duriaei CBS 260.36]